MKLKLEENIYFYENISVKSVCHCFVHENIHYSIDYI